MLFSLAAERDVRGDLSASGALRRYVRRGEEDESSSRGRAADRRVPAGMGRSLAAARSEVG
eukprot:SAG31_NODE_421_length_15868_cov_8.966453_18_plen_61_part_00